MTKKVLGINLGISHISYALTEQNNENKEDNRIIKTGIYSFIPAENPKTKESLALPRREARSGRRTNKRKKHRQKALKNLFIENKIVTNDFVDRFNNGKIVNNVWEVRTKALDGKISNEELFCVIYYIVKHRGYQNDLSSAENDGKKILSAISENIENMQDFRTYGEYLYRTGKNKYRNKKGSYDFFMLRAVLSDELNLILKTQQQLGNSLITSDLILKINEILFINKGMQSIEKMVGYCKFEPHLKRASKANLSTQMFLSLTRILNCNILRTTVNSESGEIKEDKIPLKTLMKIEDVLELAKKNKKVTFKTLRKALKGKITKDDKFGLISYSEEKDQETNVFISFEDYHKLKKAYNKLDLLDINSIDKIATILSYEKALNKKRDKLDDFFKSINLKVDSKELDDLCDISFSKFIELSSKVINKIIPYMLEGNLYHKAMELSGYNHSEPNIQDKHRLLPVINQRDKNIIRYYKSIGKSLDSVDMELTNPVAFRTISKFRKIVNAIIRKYGSFDQIVISLDKELNTKSDRNDIKKAQAKDKESKNKAIKLVEKANKIVNSSNVIKARLYLEQEAKSIYSGKTIELTRLFEDGYVHVSHVLPLSKSLDDAISNKVLVLNSDLVVNGVSKSNMTPYEWLSFADKNDNGLYEEFEARVKSSKLHKAKKGKLLKTSFNKNSQKEYTNRQVNDRRYIARVIKDYVNDYLEFASKKDNVIIVNGKLVSKLRHLWGFNNILNDGFHKYTKNAAITAFATRSMVQKLSTYYNKKETENPKKFPFFEKPNESFKDDVAEHINSTITVKLPRKKVTGEAHSQLPKSKKKWLDKKGNLKSGVEINSGMCANGEVKIVNIYEKDGILFFMPLTIIDIKLNSKLPKEQRYRNKKVWGKNEKNKAVWQDLTNDMTFKMELFKDDLITLTFESRKEIKSFEKSYFTQYNVSNANLFVIDQNNTNRSDTSMVCTIHNIIDIKKHNINLLGEVV